MNLGQVKEEENAAATMTYLLMRVIYTCIEGKSQWWCLSNQAHGTYFLLQGNDSTRFLFQCSRVVSIRM